MSDQTINQPENVNEGPSEGGVQVNGAEEVTVEQAPNQPQEVTPQGEGQQSEAK